VIQPAARTDEELMVAFQQGDAAAFDVLYQRYRGTLFRFLVRQAGNASTGEDLYQEVWMTLIRQRERWQPAATLKTYLFHIAHSRLVDHFRAQARRGGRVNSSLDDDAVPEPVDQCALHTPEGALAQRSSAQALRHCLDGLPALQREAFLFSEESGLALADIAAITGVATDAVKSRIRYAIQKLRRCLDGLLEAP
jgi:RNA polymerase sigma factor (sigma-70 family)